MKDFYSKASNTCPLQHLIDCRQGYRFITRQELDEIFKTGGAWWPGFYKKYPKAGGYWEFSVVGYNERKNEAMVYVGHHCGGLCGTGIIYLLNQDHGSWLIKNRLLLWIS